MISKKTMKETKEKPEINGLTITIGGIHKVNEQTKKFRNMTILPTTNYLKNLSRTLNRKCKINKSMKREMDDKNSNKRNITETQQTENI